MQSFDYEDIISIMTERLRRERENVFDIEAMKKLSDAVDYDSLQLQQAIINRTSEKVKKLFDAEELKLWRRRERLQKFLEGEKEELQIELTRKIALQECNYCKERYTKIKTYNEDIEQEKIRECQKALEREKIAYGMRSTKQDEIALRSMQLKQIEEKKMIEEEHDKVENMWHQVLIENVKQKELLERREHYRTKQEMIDRRKAYDEQIASANRKRQDAIKCEREKENIIIEIIKKKMEEDHLADLKRKKDQQMINKKNYLEGHVSKLSQLREDKMKAKEIDNNTIRTALSELKEERERNISKMKTLQIENRIFTENFSSERNILYKLEEESDKIVQEWIEKETNRALKNEKEKESEKLFNKAKAAKEYREYIEQRNKQQKKERRDRDSTMEQVRRVAIEELRKKMESARDELRIQMEYKHNLDKQIKENQKAFENELQNIENKQRPFTRKAELFAEAMRKVDSSPGRLSTNPVHPFRRAIAKDLKNQDNHNIQLPVIAQGVVKI